jgi:quinol monooxygenase YgiN
MYGTIARFRLKDGVDADEVQRTFESMDQPQGALGVFALRSKSDPSEVWVGGVFENEEVYYRSANSPEQSERFAKMRELMAREPEWHDGEVVQFERY